MVEKAKTAGTFGLMGYGTGTAVHDVTRGARALGNMALGRETATTSLADYAPLAVGSALGAYGYNADRDTRTKWGLKNDSNQTAGAMAGTLGYGATAALRDAYKTYKKTKSKR